MKKTLRYLGICFITIFIAKQAFSLNQIPDPTQRIIGTWYSEGSRSTKWVYKLDGRLEKYRNGVLSSTFNYSISHECGSENDSDFYFMKWIDKDGDEFCFEINGVNEDNNGILSLTSMQNGQVILYEK